jgi:hypothetical protein
MDSRNDVGFGPFLFNKSATYRKNKIKCRMVGVLSKEERQKWGRGLRPTFGSVKRKRSFNFLIIIFDVRQLGVE